MRSSVAFVSSSVSPGLPIISVIAGNQLLRFNIVRPWTTTLGHLGKPSAHVEVLRRGYRVPAAVIEFASRLLPHIAPGVAGAESVRENAGELRLVEVLDLAPAIDTETRRLLTVPGSIGVIAADATIERLSEALTVEHSVLDGQRVLDGAGTTRVTLVPATLAKGLEYDHVVVVEPAGIVAAEPSRRPGLRRLYVVLTRAVSGLTVVHSSPLPAELAENRRAVDRPPATRQPD